MTKRASLPGAAELFRSTTADKRAGGRSDGDGRQRADGVSGGTPRQRHDSKITVYVADAELLALEQARLGMRAEYGLVVDRGRVVREAVAIALADLELNGADSLLVRRLAGGAGARAGAAEVAGPADSAESSVR